MVITTLRLTAHTLVSIYQSADRGQLKFRYKQGLYSCHAGQWDPLDSVPLIAEN